MGKRNHDIIGTLKKLVREALITDYNLPAHGTRPSAYRSTMPDYMRDVAESYGYDTAKIGRVTPSKDEIDRRDQVLFAMANPELSPEERHIIWAVAARTPWGKIAARHGMARETMWRRHDRAIAKFGVVWACGEARKVA